MRDTVIITGGAGFIGSNFVRRWLETERSRIVVLDDLTYAGILQNLADFETDARFRFVKGDINDESLVSALFQEEQPRSIIHFAAESHVDRSVASPGEFIRTNINGTFNLLECARAYVKSLGLAGKDFRFLHVSTDEVYGSLGADDPAFSETTPYSPNSPYSASKAASDHLVRAYHHTYGLQTLVTNCSNNYGPFQFPEKLIPLMILNALSAQPLPVYGDGLNVRDWLFVTDHCDAIRAVLAKGRAGETYNVGGNSEMSNIEVVKAVCALLDELAPMKDGQQHSALISYVKDRPGHDRRYAIDARKIRQEIGWQPNETFASGIRKTVEWYLANPKWIELVRSGEYKKWVASHYAGAHKS
jgi:dTDP-glucose 4,6-dehydratase